MESAVKRAIAEYNRYRTPEAYAEIIKTKPSQVRLKFTGPFCISCGVLDYIEDFIYEMKKVSKADWEIAEIEAGQEFIVTYRVRRRPRQGEALA
ncbi:MAG: hypothetical protein QW390_04465 [Candidatus Bathyarchaeia archaeon]